MARIFYRADYDAALEQTVTVREVLPEGHLARFLMQEIAAWDLTPLYARYASHGGPPYAPELLLALILYGYMTGIASSRKVERATHESIPFRFLAGGYHPDHATLAAFRTQALPQVAGLVAQCLLRARQAGLLHLGAISQDGTKLQADASKHAAVSYKRCVELQALLQAEIAEIEALAAQADAGTFPDGLDLAAELDRRLTRLTDLHHAQQVLDQRAAERDVEEQAAYQAKLDARAARETTTGKKPRGKPPAPPTPGARPTDQYNFTDPESRIMKDGATGAFIQGYNAQVAVTQDTRLVVAYTLSNHPNDQHEAIPTVDAIPAGLGTPDASALDTGYCSAANIAAFEARGITPYIATGKTPHHTPWRDLVAALPDPPPADATPTVQMAYRLRTEIGHAIYRLRKCTVEPIIGIIKDTLGFRQFSLRGAARAAAEWGLVCLAYDLVRLHRLQATAKTPNQRASVRNCDQLSASRAFRACCLAVSGTVQGVIRRLWPRRALIRLP